MHGARGEVAHLLDSVKLTLPILLSNLTTVGQLGVTYNAGLEQILVLLPPAISMIQAVQPNRNASGLGLGDFRLGGISDPPACTVGFLPPSAWRSPEETDTIDTPDGLYCKLPQDSDIAVRSTQYPVREQPRQAGADRRAVQQRRAVSAPRRRTAPAGSLSARPRLRRARSVPAAPASAPGEAGAPSIGIARYDPRTGNYLGPDGRLYQQRDLVATTGRAWTDMLPH
ncbi:hypothetical protein ACW9HJ_14620 [Nocardia gipuzkoensis]